MCMICENNYEGVWKLCIKYCTNIQSILYVKGIHSLTVTYCPKFKRNCKHRWIKNNLYIKLPKIN